MLIFEDYQKDIEIDAMYLNLKNLYRKAIEMAPTSHRSSPRLQQR